MPAADVASCSVGNYRYIAHLAEGGMALVYLAVTKAAGAFEKLVVIKQLRDTLSEDPTFVTMFVDEARLAARLNHPNVVQTYEVGSDRGRHFLAMEYLEGVPYTRLLRLRERIPPPLAYHVRIICDLLYGLHYAHELCDFDGHPLGVVHRDVSPQNVMLTFDGGVKVLDFGIAKAALAAEQRPDDFKGKLEYMAPEQARLEPVDLRADIFSVGVMLWEAVARRRLYEKGEDKRARLLAGDLPKLLDVRPEAPRRLAKICARALAHHPDARYPSALEMAQELEEWLGGTTQHVTTRDLGTYLAEKFASTREKLAGAVETQLRVFREMAEQPADTNALPRMPASESYPSGLSEMPQSLPPRDPQTGMSAPSAWATEPSFGVAPVPTGIVHAASPPRRAPVAAMVVTGLVLTSLLAGGALYARSRLSANEAEARAVATASAAVTAATAVPETPDTPSPATEEIDYTIKASPSHARILIDGQLTSNPTTGHGTKDGSPHVIRVEADGFQPKEEVLAFDRSLLLTLELKPIAAPAATSAASRKGSPRPAPRAVRAAPAPRAAPKTEKLDTENPYK